MILTAAISTIIFTVSTFIYGGLGSELGRIGASFVSSVAASAALLCVAGQLIN